MPVDDFASGDQRFSDAYFDKAKSHEEKCRGRPSKCDENSPLAGKFASHEPALRHDFRRLQSFFVPGDKRLGRRREFQHRSKFLELAIDSLQQFRHGRPLRSHA